EAETYGGATQQRATTLHHSGRIGEEGWRELGQGGRPVVRAHKRLPGAQVGIIGAELRPPNEALLEIGARRVVHARLAGRKEAAMQRVDADPVLDLGRQRKELPR